MDPTPNGVRHRHPSGAPRGPSATLRLAALLFCIGLATSRAGLLLHELGGHAAVGAALGCRLAAMRLFVFGGGWVRLDCGPLALGPALAIDLGGIALQLVLGGLLLAAAARRRAGGAGLLAACAGLLFVLHAGYYLVTGTHEGVGDGRQLHRLLGERRGLAVAAGALALVAACGAFALDLARRLAPRLPDGPPARRVAVLAAAVLLAGGLHGALAWAEQRLRRDPVYAAIFEPEAVRRVEVELQRRLEIERAPGASAAPSPDRTAAERAVLEAAHAPFPLKPVLCAAMAVAALAGFAVALRSR